MTYGRLENVTVSIRALPTKVPEILFEEMVSSSLKTGPTEKGISSAELATWGGVSDEKETLYGRVDCFRAAASGDGDASGVNQELRNYSQTKLSSHSHSP